MVSYYELKVDTLKFEQKEAYHSSPAGPNFNLSCKKDKYILSPAISLEVLTLEKRYYTR